jgi:thioredoxin reductase (NADPH)
VVIVGGGNTAVEEAIYLTNHATKVTLVHRRDHLRAEKIMQDRCSAIRRSRWSGIRRSRKCWAAAILPGVTVSASATSRPAPPPIFRPTAVRGDRPHAFDRALQGEASARAEGYLLTKPDSTATEIPGVFAAGDVKDKVFRQAVTAAGMGCMAALEAERFLAAHEHEEARAAE